MIREPYNVSPYNETVDTSSATDFSFDFSGDKLSAFKIDIFENNTSATTPLATSGVVYSGDYYNGERVQYAMPADTSLLNKNLIWRTLLIEDTAIYHIGTFTIESNDGNGNIGIKAYSAYDGADFVNDQYTISCNGTTKRITSYTLSTDAQTGILHVVLNDRDKSNSSLFKVGQKAYLYRNWEDSSNVNYATLQIATGRLKKVTSSTEVEIGSFPKLKGYDTTNGKYAELNIDGVKRKITSYNYATGVAKLGSAITGMAIGDNFVVKTNFTYSSYFFFKSIKKATLSIVNITDNTSVLDSREYSFIGQYLQADGEQIKYHTWTLADLTKSKVEVSTDKIFDSNLILEYSELESGHSYNILLKVVTQDNTEIVASSNFSVIYDDKVLRLNPKIMLNEDDHSIELTWPANQYSIPSSNISDSYCNKTILTGVKRNGQDILKGLIMKSQSFVQYNNVSDKEFGLSNHDYILLTSLGFFGDTYGDFIKIKVSENEELIGEKRIGTDGEIFKFYLKGKEAEAQSAQVYYSNQFILSNPHIEGVTDDGVGTVHGFSWMDNAQWSDSENWNESSISKYPIILTIGYDTTRNNLAVSFIGNYINSSTPTFYFNISKNNLQNLTFLNKIQMDYFALMSKPDIDTTLKDEIVSNFYQPTWNDFDMDCLILCPYESENGNPATIASSSDEYVMEKIKQYSVYRQEINRKTNEIESEKLIYILDMDGRDSIPTLKDFSVSNKKKYAYTIYPATTDMVTAHMTSKVLPVDWEGWTFTSVALMENKNYYRPISETWKFLLNLDAESITVNSDRVIYNNLSQYPKTSIGNNDYLTIPFTSLLGEYNMKAYDREINGLSYSPLEYYDEADRIQAFRKFCNSPFPVLVKDNKGFCFLGIISDLTFEISEEIESMPTTVSFTITQIGDLKNNPVIMLK